MSLLLNITLRPQLSSKNLDFSTFYKFCSSLRVFSSKRSLSTVKENNSIQEPTKIYKEIYRFHYIRFGYAINKIKWPQTLLTALVLPTSAAMYFGGIFDFDVLSSIIFSGIIITTNVYLYGSIFYKAVGFMYLSEDGSTLKLSYLDFWGARVDKEVPVVDVMPLADCPKSPTDYFYTTIHFYSTDKLQLKLYLKTGGKVTDVNRFVRVFGDYTKY